MKFILIMIIGSHLSNPYLVLSEHDSRAECEAAAQSTQVHPVKQGYLKPKSFAQYQYCIEAKK